MKEKTAMGSGLFSKMPPHCAGQQAAASSPAFSLIRLLLKDVEGKPAATAIHGNADIIVPLDGYKSKTIKLAALVGAEDIRDAVFSQGFFLGRDAKICVAESHSLRNRAFRLCQSMMAAEGKRPLTIGMWKKRDAEGGEKIRKENEKPRQGEAVNSAK